MSEDKVVEDNKYTDIESLEGGLGELKEIKRLPQMHRNAPQIRWGQEYLAWPVEKRLDFAEKLASSMNHAADILQQERNKLLEVVEKQKEQLKMNVESYMSQGRLIHKELGTADAEKQVLYQEIVSLKQQVKELTKRLFDRKD
jgi:hypothetical protein